MIVEEIRVWKRGENNSILNTTIEEVIYFLNNTNEIECDTETTGLDPHTSEIMCIQFGNKDNQYLTAWENLDKLIPLLKPIFNSNKLFIFQNAKFDLQFLYKYNLTINKVYDTFLAECILTCGIDYIGRDLKTLIKRYLGIEISKEIRKDISKLGLTEEVISYGLDDVKYLSRIKEQQLVKITELNLNRALDLDNEFVKVLAYIEYCGIGFDKDKWLKNYEDNLKVSNTLLEKMNYQIVHLGLKKFYSYADLFSTNAIIKDGKEYCPTIVWTSPKQVASLFKELGINVSIESNGEFKDSVGKQFLQQNEKSHILVELYSEFIKNQKLLSSFGQNYIKFINPKTNRIHTTYKQILNTGRMSSGNASDKKPNLQQLPADSRYRECFVPEENNIMIASDYSGMESVVFANKCLDQGLLDFYDKDLGDMHSYVAKMCFKEELEEVPLEDVKHVRKDLRQDAKAAGFAIQFGGVGYTIADNLGVSEERGDAVYNAYMEAFPGVAGYFKEVFEETLHNGYITFNEITNRKSFFNFLDEFNELQEFMDKMDWKLYRLEKGNNTEFYKNTLSKNVKRYFKLKGQIERKSYNYPVQGSAADVTKTALLFIWKYILKNNLFNIVKIANVVHDEVIIECPIRIVDAISDMTRQSMIKAGELFFKRVKLDASCDIGDHWIH